MYEKTTENFDKSLQSQQEIENQFEEIVEQQEGQEQQEEDLNKLVNDLEKQTKKIEKEIISKGNKLSNLDVFYDQQIEMLKLEKIEKKKSLVRDLKNLKKKFKESLSEIQKLRLKLINQI